MFHNSDESIGRVPITRPPMLIELLTNHGPRIRCTGREGNGLPSYLQSIDQGPFELGNHKATHIGYVRATNIVLQGLPKDIYKLINHNIEAKAIWDNVKMLLAGSELTKEDRESQLYNEFERFKMLPGENINEYYVLFHKLVNDIRNIRMIMPNIQLNSKFVNNMSPEWDWFVTAVKLNKGLKETNHEQLYAYLKQHEKHAAQDRLIIKRIAPSTNDPLAFIVVQNVQGRQNQNQWNFARGNGAAGFGGMQNGTGNVNVGQGKPIKCYNCNGIGHIARNYTQPKSPQNSDYFKDKMLLMQAQENGAVLDEEELLFLAGEQGNTFDAYVDNQPVQDLALNEDNSFQADECDAFDLDVDDELTAQNIFMANLSSAGSANPQAGPSNASILFEVHTLENAIDHSVTNQNEHEIHNEVQQSNVIDSTSVHMGAQNPFYLKKAKVAQPALYDGNELINLDHDPIDVPSSEEDLELAELTRQKMHEKLNDPVCVEKGIKYLAKRKAEELKANAPPLPVLPPATVYPPNTPVHLVPRTLPTTSQVNISLYVITQLFWDFEKTCKKRITPTGITEGEWGFEQTKRCYLTEIIPFFNLLKEHFDGVQKTLVTEVRAMKVVFEEMEAEVDQNAIDKKYGEIERKNLLITNENLIANCIAQDVFYTITDSTLSASRFNDLSTAYNAAMNRVVELESENSRLLRKIKHDDHDTMIKTFSKLEVAHINLQLKQQHLKENANNLKSKSP
ncbi:retrovirus-related pol polyprotein from transposon TNT 1-94 [Tanacetum coccineum]